MKKRRVVIEEDQALPHWFDFRKHSPGRLRAGASQVLDWLNSPSQSWAEAVGVEKARGCCHEVTVAVIAGFQEESWELAREEVREWYRSHPETDEAS